MRQIKIRKTVDKRVASELDLRTPSGHVLPY
jgi:hypothetical protein